MPAKVLQENKHIRGVIDKIPSAKFWRNKRYDKCHNDKQTLKIPIAKFCWQPNCDRDYKITTSKICKKNPTGMWLIVLGFNNTSTLEGHFVSSPREREKRDRRESRGDEREGQGRKRNRNESEETEEIKTFPLYPYPLQG